MASIMQTTSGRKLVKNIVVYALCSMVSIILLIPFFWMLSASLKPGYQIFKYPIIWIPNPVKWSNYVDAFRAVPYMLWTKNTSLIVALSIVGDLVSCSLVAYAFARLRFPGRSILFALLLSTLMIPQQVTLIPTFLLFKWLGWVDTYLPLILPAWMAYPFWVFLLRQFFMTIPLELDDAAKIDGCGYMSIFCRILLPLAKPALTTIAIFSFMANWNDFMRPLIYLNTESRFTIALGLRMFQGLYFTRWELVMAASVLALLPPLILFFFCQRYFVQGIVMTGLKG
ncbi:MAG: carbohydrate ABC transporter permease [Firmicutes bacterium]|nr:carbohydrate ABC transporter permease [Bacillota bacterium]